MGSGKLHGREHGTSITTMAILEGDQRIERNGMGSEVSIWNAIKGILVSMVSITIRSHRARQVVFPIKKFLSLRLFLHKSHVNLKRLHYTTIYSQVVVAKRAKRIPLP